jgi:hypothetical protein
MDTLSQKLRLIYTKLFNENIDTFTEALIDYKKFDRDKFDFKSETKCKEQFFLNRKTVLRRWLQKGTKCTPDFQKSFNNYKLSHYQLKGKSLFRLEDFKEEENEEWFDHRIDEFLKNQKRVQLKTPYRLLYFFCESSKTIIHYEIVEWSKGEKGETLITVEQDGKKYEGTFKLTDENNIFITIEVNNNTTYMLFNETHDCAIEYIVGVSMGYLKEDNMVPRSQKIIFSKEALDVKNVNIPFILNETEVLSSIENRLNLSSQEIKVNPFTKYANQFQKYYNFFKKLSKDSYKQSFYHRLAFHEFYALKKLFKKVSKEESYYIMDYQRAFLELIKTVEEIGDISLQVVMRLDDKNLFLQSSRTDLEIRSKFLNLYSMYNVKTTILFVIDADTTLDIHTKLLLSEMQKHQIEVRIIEDKKIINKVNSTDFTFIHLNDKRDFVLADPIRDSKDVYKLFIDKLTMDEYRTDYKRFIEKSKVYNAEN